MSDTKQISNMGEVIMQSLGVSLYEIAQERDPERRKKMLEAKRKADARFTELQMDITKKYGG